MQVRLTLDNMQKNLEFAQKIQGADILAIGNVLTVDYEVESNEFEESETVRVRKYAYENSEDISVANINVQNLLYHMHKFIAVKMPYYENDNITILDHGMSHEERIKALKAIDITLGTGLFDLIESLKVTANMWEGKCTRLEAAYSEFSELMRIITEGE